MCFTLIISVKIVSHVVLNYNIPSSVSYTILSVKQEKIMDDIDEEAKIVIMKGPRTGANS